MTLVLAALLVLAQEKPIVLKGGQIVTMAGKEIDGGLLLVEGGKIRAAGTDVEIPAGAQVIELPKGSQVLPGFIDLHSHLGSALDIEEAAEASTPRVKAVEAFTSRHADVRAALHSGVTCVALAPGNGNVVGGRIGVVKLNGGRYDRALFRDSVALKVSLGTEALRRDREPTSLAGALRMARAAVRDGADLPLWVHASTTGEIEGALELIRTAERPAVILHAREAARFGPARLKGVTIAFGPLGTSDSRETLETPAALQKAGARLAFVSDAPASPEDHLRVTASFAVKYGLDRVDALRALTATPAAALGLSREIGTLEAGKDADVVVWTGDPLTLTSAVELVLVNGIVIYRRQEKP